MASVACEQSILEKPKISKIQKKNKKTVTGERRPFSGNPDLFLCISNLWMMIMSKRSSAYSLSSSIVSNQRYLVCCIIIVIIPYTFVSNQRYMAKAKVYGIFVYGIFIHIPLFQISIRVGQPILPSEIIHDRHNDASDTQWANQAVRINPSARRTRLIIAASYFYVFLSIFSLLSNDQRNPLPTLERNQVFLLYALCMRSFVTPCVVFLSFPTAKRHMVAVVVQMTHTHNT